MEAQSFLISSLFCFVVIFNFAQWVVVGLVWIQEDILIYVPVVQSILILYLLTY